MKSRIISQLEQELRGQLPGQDAQFQMATLSRYNKLVPPMDARDAGVLILLYPKAHSGNLHIVFIERQSLDGRDHHRGQIAFPGGKREPEDADLSFTARREAEEEVGVDKDEIILLGSLTQLYVPVSRFLIHPHVGFIDKEPAFVPQPSEVKKIIEAPLEQLLDVRSRRRKDIEAPNKMMLRDVPFFEINGHTVWGATAMILSEFLALGPFRSR